MAAERMGQTKEQIELIFSAIEVALNETKLKFKVEPTQKKKKFRL